MSDPTAAQIAADGVDPTYEVQLWDGGSWVSVAGDVVRVSHALATTGDLGGFLFGTGRAVGAEVAIDAALFATGWQARRIRIGYGLGASNRVIRFTGVITGRSRSGRDGVWRCGGLDALLAGVKVWSPLIVGRPAATATSATSVEDPTSGSYRGGILNYIAWASGGRPLAQAASYPAALFYYEFQRSLLEIPYAWVSGENLWNEADRICKASGGQIYQDDSGTLRYVNPLGLAEGSATYTFTDADLTPSQYEAQNAGPYETASEESDLRSVLSAVSCTYVRRARLGYQEVYNQTNPVRDPIRPGETVTLTLDTQLPLAAPELIAVETDSAIQRTLARPSAAQLVTTIADRKATRVVVTLTNAHTEPILLYGIRLKGTPVGAIETGSASYSGTTALNSDRVLEVPDNALIQTASQARRLCRLIWDFQSGERGIITLTGCPYDHRRSVGELVLFTSADWGETAVPCRIAAIRPTGDGFMDVDLGRSVGLPVRSQFYVIGGSYANATIRELSY